MNNEKEKMILENLLSSKDVFSRCISILKPSYFDVDHRTAVTFIKDYYEKYRAIPNLDILKAETSIEFKQRDITTDMYNYTCDTIEKFCQSSAMKHAIMSTMKEVEDPNGNMGLVFEAIKQAQTVSLAKDIGFEFYDSPEERLKSFVDSSVALPTHIHGLDKHLDGGCFRTQLTLFSANSGGGKSIMLANLGANYSKDGYRVLYISLELQQPMIYIRLSSIVSGIAAKTWKEQIAPMAHAIEDVAKTGAGSYIIKKLPIGSSANDIRSFLKLYQLEFGCNPDILIIDYLDLMRPNEGIGKMNISEQDKAKSEQLVELLEEFNCVGLSASQQNREAIGNSSPDQSIIAGGLTKVNTVDNYISIFMDPSMRLTGQMILFFLKTRSSSGVGNSEEVKFDPENLRITDKSGISIKFTPEENKKKNKNYPSGKIDKKKSRADEILASIKNLPPEVKDEFDVLNKKPILEEPTEEIMTDDIEGDSTSDLLSMIERL